MSATETRTNELAELIGREFPRWATGFVMVHDDEGRFLGRISIGKDGRYELITARRPASAAPS